MNATKQTIVAIAGAWITVVLIIIAIYYIRTGKVTLKVGVLSFLAGPYFILDFLWRICFINESIFINMCPTYPLIVLLIVLRLRRRLITKKQKSRTKALSETKIKTYLLIEFAKNRIHETEDKMYHVNIDDMCSNLNLSKDTIEDFIKNKAIQWTLETCKYGSYQYVTIIESVKNNCLYLTNPACEIIKSFADRVSANGGHITPTLKLPDIGDDAFYG